MKKLIVALVSCLGVACVSGSVEDDVSLHQSLVVPGIPDAPQVSQTVVVAMDFDMSDFMGEMYKHSSSVDLSVNDNSLTITDGTEDFSFLKHLTITILAKNAPELVFSDLDVQDTGKKLVIPVLLTSEKMMDYLSESASLKFTLTGYIPQSTFTVEYSFALHVKANVSKSIPDLVSK